MEESYETFEEELGPSRAEPPPQKPVRQICRPEMYTARKIREEVTPLPQQPRSEPKTLPREGSFGKTTSLHKALSIQNLTQIEKPWENVTLNRCLFVAISILVLTSGLQKLNETLRGHGTSEEEEEAGLTMRRSGLRHRGQPPEPEKSLWEVLLWWLPDLDDEEEEDEDDEEIKRGKSKRGVTSRTSKTSTGLRNRPLPDKKLLKERRGTLSERRAKRGKEREIKDDPEEGADEDNKETVPKKNKKSEEKKKKAKKV
ncbi:uncharacterized protein LOC133451932 [Cololabis saira]|uniref:uncharacterized protein LOC133451932 n=1 Tax=Cololabis saira TaxID=129043 RepID=UPI002AD3B44E|nr:uncharacterized protein LOC133451932 [Cololabis saira]XP_061587074.1 uncharacterized protein LOC133451932 [Cololabis saira]